jgi:hypothetical protein
MSRKVAAVGKLPGLRAACGSPGRRAAQARRRPGRDSGRTGPGRDSGRAGPVGTRAALAADGRDGRDGPNRPDGRGGWLPWTREMLSPRTMNPTGSRATLKPCRSPVRRYRRSDIHYPHSLRLPGGQDTRYAPRTPWG